MSQKTIKILLIASISLFLSSCAHTPKSYIKKTNPDFIAEAQSEKKVGIISFEVYTDHSIDGTAASLGATVGPLAAVAVGIAASKSENNNAKMIAEGYHLFYNKAYELIENQLLENANFKYIKLDKSKTLSPEPGKLDLLRNFSNCKEFKPEQIKKIMEENELDVALQVSITPEIYLNDRSFFVHTAWELFNKEGQKEVHIFQRAIGGKAEKRWFFYYVEDPKYNEVLVQLLHKNIDDFLLIMDGKQPVNSELAYRLPSPEPL